MVMLKSNARGKNDRGKFSGKDTVRQSTSGNRERKEK